MRWFIPEVGPSSVRREGTQPSRPAKVWCELCGVDLPDAFEGDAFPVCGICAEEILQSQVSEGTP